MPEVSVLMGTYNEKSKEYTARAIDSILGQTFADFEFIICDDGSAPAFYSWLVQYCKKDIRIMLLHNSQNQGLAVVLNRCLKYATGIYIARMDADDISKPDRLEKQVKFLRQHKKYAFVGCGVELVGVNGLWGVRMPKEVPVGKSFLSTSPFIHPTVMIRREVMLSIHGYCESKKLLRAEDYDFFMRLYAAGYQGYNIQETLFQYREDLDAYRKRKYCYRINECLVRYLGFRRLDMLKGNFRYVLKPLAAGVIPHTLMYHIRRRRFSIK